VFIHLLRPLERCYIQVIVRTLRFLFSNLGVYKRMFWTLLLVGALDGVAAFSVPILLAQFTKPPLSTQLLSQLLPLVVLCLATSLFFQWCLRGWGECLTGWLCNALQRSLFRRTERLSGDTLALYHSGYLSSLIGQVAGSVGTIASSMVWLLGHLVTTLVLFVYWTAQESVTLAVVNGVIFALFVTVSVYLSRKIVPFANEKNVQQAALSERFVDFLINITTVKKLGIVDWADAKIKNEAEVMNGAISRFQRFHARRWLILHSIFYSAMVLTIAVVLYKVEQGIVAPSIFILFIAGFARVQNYAERLSEMIKGLIETNAYVERLESILALVPAVGEQSTRDLETLECKNVRHRFGSRNQDISVPHFAVTAGERILISGKSGQGKSTFLTILADQRLPLEGQCLWNGRPYAEYDESLAHTFAYASQEAELFNLSLRENLVMDRPIDDHRVTELLRQLGLEDLLHTLPHGLDTLVGEKGLRLSAGQKQRVNIARALLLERSMILLDEPTSHLDAQSEAAVVRCLGALPRDVTLVIVSHREALRAICDREYAFRDGILVAA
jgi:ATP-binding cassette subfamily B protein